MKTRLATVLAFLVCSSLALAADWQTEYARLLGKYVTPAGVKYSEWKASAEDMKAIQAVVDGVAVRVGEAGEVAFLEGEPRVAPVVPHFAPRRGVEFVHPFCRLFVELREHRAEGKCDFFTLRGSADKVVVV